MSIKTGRRNGQVPIPNNANSQSRNPRGQNVCSGGCGRERCSYLKDGVGLMFAHRLVVPSIGRSTV